MLNVWKDQGIVWFAYCTTMGEKVFTDFHHLFSLCLPIKAAGNCMLNTWNMLIVITEDKWTPSQTHFWIFEFLLKGDSFVPLYNFSQTKCESVGGQGYPNKHHEHFKVIFSITREEIQLPVKIGDKNLNLTQPSKEQGTPICWWCPSHWRSSWRWCMSFLSAMGTTVVKIVVFSSTTDDKTQITGCFILCKLPDNFFLKIIGRSAENNI